MTTWILLLTYWSISTHQYVAVQKTYPSQELCEAARDAVLYPYDQTAKPIAFCHNDGTEFKKQLNAALGQ